MHLSGAQVVKAVHLATKMCSLGAGCTLNFEHCNILYARVLKTKGYMYFFNRISQFL